MAKKRRKDEKEETYEWVPPEFDEKAFLKKDIEGTKALMLTAVIAVVFGIAAFALDHSISVIVAFLAYVVGAVILQKIYGLFKLDPEAVDKKLLAGNIALYMLLALGIWILLLNEPFI